MSELVRRLGSTVAVGGMQMQCVDVKIDREIATALPAAVAGGGGLVKSTASLTLLDPAAGDAATERRSPWAPRDGWPPQRSAAVRVHSIVDDGEPSRRFTGRVLSVDGSATDPVAVDAEDAIDDLHVQVSHSPLLRVMPPVDGQTLKRRVDLRADYVADRVLRQAGFHCTPRTQGRPLLSVPGQGSMWPEVGACTACDSIPAGNYPFWYPAPWGWAFGGVAATYRYDDGGTIEGRALMIAAMVDPNQHDGVLGVEAHLGATNPSRIALRVAGNRNVQVLYDGLSVAGITPPGDWRRVQMTHNGHTIRLRTDTGWEWSTSHAIYGEVRTRVYDRADVAAANGARVAGIQVGWVSGHDYTGYVNSPLTARIRPGQLSMQMEAMPALVSRDGLDLLREISEATVCSMWIDREGVLQWVHPDRLRDQPPAATLTADADLLDLAWEDTADSARRSVTVKYRQQNVTIGRGGYAVTAWEGPGETISQGETLQLIASPPADEDWIMVDDSPRQMLILANGVSDPAGVRDFNRGVGSWVGGSPINNDGDSASTKVQAYNDNPDGADTSYQGHGFPTMVWPTEQIGPQAWKITQTLNDISDNYWIDLSLKLDLPDSLRRPIGQRWNGQSMPILRAKARTEWTDEEHVSSITGPDGYEALTHDVGPWAGYSVAALADWIADQVTQPAPILRDLRIVYRTDVGLGDVVDVVEDRVHHVRLRVLVVGLDEDHTEASSDLTLTCRILSARSTRFTYDDQAAAWAGRSYTQLANAGGTYETREDA